MRFLIVTILEDSMQRYCFRFLAAFVVLLSLYTASAFTVSAASEKSFGPEIGEYIQLDYDRSGLLSNEANAIVNTGDGYIWIGSYSGLARYDSTSIVTYGDDDDSLMNGVSVRSLYEDSNGRLWIGSNEKGLYYYENGEFFFVNTEIASASGSIRGFAETESGLYVASTGGIMLVTPEMEVHRIGIADIGDSHVAGMHPDNRGYLWVIDNDSIAVLNGRDVVFSTGTREYSDNDCNCITQLSDGRMLIGTGGSEVIIVAVSGSDYQIESMILDDKRTTNKHTVDCQTVNCLLEDSYGRIWVCSDTGLGYIDGNDFYSASGIDFGSLECVEIDYEGNIWLASSRQGVMQLVRGRFDDKSMATGLHGVIVNATQIYDGLLFVATDEGVQVFDPVSFAPVEHPVSVLLDGIRIRGLFMDSKGYLWITTYKDYGVVRYKDGEYVSISTEEGLTSNKTRVTMELPNGDIAVSTGGGVSIIRGTEVVRTYTEADGLDNPVILSMCMDKQGNMYFGSDGNGIYVVSPEGVISTISATDGLGSGVILNLRYDDKMDAVWVVTGSFLSYIDSSGIHCLDSFTAGTGSIFDILFIDDAMWILRNTSVIITDREQILSGAASSEYTILNRKDGLIDITANSRQCLDEDGNLYLASSDGVYTINTSNIGMNDISHKAIINNVFADGVAYNTVNDTVFIPADTKRLTIEFTALNYCADSCMVEYQLSGADDQPVLVEGNKAHTRDYTNLRGGSYVFHVSVINANGLRSEQVIELTVRKELAYYEHISFIICAIILSAALLAGLIYFIVKKRTESLLLSQRRYHSLTESALHVAARSIDAKDSYTNGHSSRVAVLALEIARRLGWSQEELENVYYTALVHDIGKIGVPDSLLTKPSRLTDEEYRIIQTHTTTGYNILREFEGVPDIALGARYHHERYDGTGYCEGLSGEDIPMVARIIAVADAYDAMTSSRVYRSRFSQEKARGEIERCKGTQFDPQIADILLQMLDDNFDAFEENE